MNWHDAAVLIGPTLAAGIASWFGVSAGLASLRAKVEAQNTRIGQVETDVRYAHQRINELPFHRHPN